MGGPPHFQFCLAGKTFGSGEFPRKNLLFQLYFRPKTMGRWILAGIFMLILSVANCEDEMDEEKALYPSIFNLATNAIITSNATCGQDKAEHYCKLVEHVFMRQPQCDICEDNNPHYRHPIEFAIDGTNRWWQSPPIANGFKFEWVTITIDLRQRYQVAYIIIKAGIAPRPGNWILEKSLDNVTWTAWQYYAINDAECEEFYGVEATPGHPKYTRDDQAICTSYFSKLDPLEDGEIHTSLILGRPGISGAGQGVIHAWANSSSPLMDWTTTRYVRLRLQKLRTLHADLMVITRNRQEYIDPSVTRRYFYSIRDISIGGQCICYGHASTCPPDPRTGQMKCACSHNTCGDSCKQCCPMFHQQPWRPGTVSNPNKCELCQCFNHANDCKYDDEIARKRLSVNTNGIFEGGGVCIACDHNTEGNNCERCKDGWYRPAGVSHYDRHACRPCDCDATGSLDGNCIKDESKATDDLKPGDCVCKSGFGGRTCDRCALGYRNHPICEPCPCHKAGASNYATCDDECVCKANVEGKLCDKCKVGHFNLDENNQEGCTKCFCSGLSSECKEANWGKEKIVDLMGWKLSGLSGGENISPSEELGTALVYNNNQITDRSLYCWKAPSSYRGSLVTSYGGMLKYFVYFVPEADGPTMPIPDVILRGNGISIEHHSRSQFFPRENVSVQVHFHESGGWVYSENRSPVSKRDFMRVLSNVDSFQLKAMYHHYQVQASIYGVALDKAEHDSTNTEKLTSVEECVCPPNYDGLSCEACVSGFRRSHNIIYEGKCEKCNCNDHSRSCDPYTGHCLNCLHNTGGARCEHCATGYYGNPLLGGTDGECKRCGCPLTSDDNNFSPTCTLTHYGVASLNDDYICTMCANGYIGNRCEMCADGYFGDPKAAKGSCKPCECNDNVDPAAVGNCDRASGKCLKCIGNTEGHSCEACKFGFYGSALAHNCTDCECHLRGSEELNCNNDTGDCKCKEFFTGKHCDRCVAGHGDIENKCPECMCSAIGSQSEVCDPVSGQCPCKQGIFGVHCDQCIKGYYNFTESGCVYCNCYDLGSVEGNCDVQTGKCQCKQAVEGRECSHCADGFFNITSGTGCAPCNCHSLGAEESTCNQRSGSCRCKYGVTGLQCDKCLPGHYGLSAEGCKRCKECPAPGQVCHPDTGECVCPPNTIGEMCEDCAKESWNYHPLKGCELCDCNPLGSTGSDCNLLTGNCTCHPQHRGQHCDQCQHGTFGFPTCEKCRCFKAGSNQATCSRDHECSCDEKGKCDCKANVEGEKCRKCKTNSFSLEADHPLGCTECFCFGRTEFCIQASYFWQQISADDRFVFFAQPYVNWERRHGLQVFPHSPGSLYSYPTDQTPLYFSLEKKFLGDKVTSYNGHLRFGVANSLGESQSAPVRPDSHLFTHLPLVVLVGNHRIVLEYYRKHPSDNGMYSVKLREDYWRVRNSKEIPVTRQMFMVALQNLQAVYIRGTFVYGPNEATLSHVTLDTAVFDNSSSVNNTAIGVEQCDQYCPPQYSGLSCQNPSEGYCRKKIPRYLDSSNDLDLIGSAEPCFCNGHSNTCERESCLCTKCQHNTEGDFCGRCQRGFYGDATIGSDSDCKKCACPREDMSFSDSCIPSNSGRGYNCTACQPGYTGQYCESCLPGYFGDPMQPDGTCEPCNCNPGGSTHGICDRLTGQCECCGGIVGRDCSECQARHALYGTECVSCDQHCTKDLMIDVDHLENLISSYNLSGVVPAPWGKLGEIENRTKALEDVLKALLDQKDDSDAYPRELKEFEDFGKKVNGLAYLADLLSTRAIALKETVQNATEEATQLERDVEAMLNKMRKAVESMQTYLYGGVLDKTSPSDVSTLSEQAKRLFDLMNETAVRIRRPFVRAELELEKARKILSDVASRKLPEKSFKQMTDRLNDINDRLMELRKKTWDVVAKNGHNAKDMNNITNKMIDRYDELMEELEEVKKEVERQADMGEKLSGNTTELLLDAHDAYKLTNISLMDEVQNVTSECELKANQYGQLLPEYQRDFVDKARNHAEQLDRQAKNLKAILNAEQTSFADALTASEAYQNMAEALRNASLAATEAKKASQTTEDDLSGQGSVIERSNASLKNSQDLLARAKALSLDGIGDDLHVYERRIKEGNENYQSHLKKEKDQRKAFTPFDSTHSGMKKMGKVAENAKKKATKANIDADTMHDAVDQLDKEVSKLNLATGKSVVQNLTVEVQKMTAKAEEARNRLNSAMSQAELNEQKIADLNNKLAQLKEKIQEVKQKADMVKLSVKSADTAECVREFHPEMTSTVTNTIRFKYRPPEGSPIPDSLILLIRTPKVKRNTLEEYMAVVMHEQFIKFLWRVGTTEESVVNTKRIDPILKKEQQWYLIEVKRINNQAELNVTRIQFKNNLIFDKVDSTESVSTGDKTKAKLFHYEFGKTVASLGAKNGSFKSAGIDVTNQFRGVIHDLVIDDTPVPLWNFVSTSQGCQPYNSDSRYQPQRHDIINVNSGFKFRDGYAQLFLAAADIGYEKRSQETTIQVDFATYTENGLLYFRGDLKDKDFIAVDLVEGRIRLQFFLGGSGKFMLETRKSYNDGNFYSVVASRYASNGSLTVTESGSNTPLEDPFKVITSPMKDLNVKGARHFVGGVPVKHNSNIWKGYNINWKGFYGCITKVTWAEHELFIQRAEKTVNVTAGCQKTAEPKLVSTDRVVGFDGVGYLRVAGLSFGAASSMALSFKTSEENGILLYQSDQVATSHRFVRRQQRLIQSDDPTDQSKGFVAVYLHNGKLFVRVGTVDDHLQLTTSGIYHDEKMHTLFISRSRDNEIVLFVDEEKIDSGKLKMSEPIGSPRLDLSVGGVGDLKPPAIELPITEGFSGCISDLLFSNEPVPLIPASPDALKSATVGHCTFFDTHVGTTAEGEKPQADTSRWKDDKPKYPYIVSGADRVTTTTKTTTITTTEAPTTTVMEATSEEEMSETTETITETFGQSETTEKQTTTELDTIFCGDDFAQLKNAAKYGQHPHSYSRFSQKRVTVGAPKADSFVENFTITFDFVTEHPDGILFVWINAKSDRQHRRRQATVEESGRWVMAYLKDGAFHLQVKGHKPVLDFEIPGKMDNSKWREVKLMKMQDQVAIQIDNDDPIVHEVPRKLRLRPLFVGGIPKKLTKPDWGVQTSLKGCIRNFMMKDKGKMKEKLLKDKYVKGE